MSIPVGPLSLLDSHLWFYEEYICAFQEVIEQVKERKIPIVIDAVSTAIIRVQRIFLA